MKKLIFFLFLTIVYQNIFSQESLGNARIGFNVFLLNNINSERVETGEYVGYFGDYDKTNYKIGFQIERNLSDRITINSGINYSNQDFTGTYYCEVCDFSAPPQPETIKFQFLEIPLSVKYYFLENNFRPFVDLGLINQFALKNDLSEKNYALRSKLGGGLEYYFNSNTAIQASINYDKGLTKMFENSDFKIEILSVGMGFLYRL